MILETHRPRNINASRAAALLYGDWGTSKAYVIGLAFVLGGYASFWSLLAVSILSLFVGLSYIIICRCYPKGGGVYSSLQNRALTNKKWEWGAILGALFLVADYLITASLSALSAFSYIGVADAIFYSSLFILVVGVANYMGPKHTGTFGIIIAIGAVSVFTGLALLSLPFLKQGISHLAPIHESPLTFWTQFCSVIVALSGIETIANTTPIMKLNKRASLDNPAITETSTPAILLVMTEVIIYTVLFGLAATAIPNFTVHDLVISAPGSTNIQDNMLNYLASYFGLHLFGSTFSLFFAKIMSIVLALILISAVNSAMNGLIALQYLMASDGELPPIFQKVNKYGVPLIPLVLVTVLPVVILFFVRKIVLLADLYAIGFVGAIAVNLFATSTDRKLPIKRWERIFMFTVFLVMGSIELTLFIQKSHARYFVLATMLVGLALRWLAKSMRKEPAIIQTQQVLSKELIFKAPICITKRLDQALKYTIKYAKEHQTHVNVIFVKELRFLTEKDFKRNEMQDPIARKVIDYIKQQAPHLVSFKYTVTDTLADHAISYAEFFEAQPLIIDAPSPIIALIRGNYAKMIRKWLPEEVEIKLL